MGTHIEYDTAEVDTEARGIARKAYFKNKDSPVGTVYSRVLYKMARNMKRGRYARNDLKRETH